LAIWPKHWPSLVQGLPPTLGTLTWLWTLTDDLLSTFGCWGRPYYDYGLRRRRSYAYFLTYYTLRHTTFYTTDYYLLT